MQSSMRSNKKRQQRDDDKSGVEATSFGDHQSSAEFANQGGPDGEPQPLARDIPYTFLLLEERYLENLDTRCII